MIEVNPHATLALQMDLPRIARSDMTRVSELLAKYRGIKLTLAAQGFEAEDEAMVALDGLEQALVATRLHVTGVLQCLSMPPQGAPAMSGHSSADLEHEVERENEPEAEPEPWEAKPDDEGNVLRPAGTSDAAKAARAKYRKPPRTR